jgi:hypothetical protein
MDANQFLAHGAASVGVTAAITQGFLALNVAAAICCGLATLALLATRRRALSAI